MKTVPKFVADQYGSARAFKENKRALIRQIRKDISELRRGCAFFPVGSKDVDAMADAADKVMADISVKNWGR